MRGIREAAKGLSRFTWLAENPSQVGDNAGWSPRCVFDRRPEEVLGVVQVKDLLHAYMSGEPRRHVRPAPVIPDTADALDIVDLVRNASAHMALVHDEYGHSRAW